MARFHQEVAIKAPAETVWQIIADSKGWPLWFPAVEGATTLSAVQVGSSFQWQEKGEVNTGRITRSEPGKVLEVVTKEGNRQATHRFELAYRNRLLGADATEVDYTMEYDAPGGVIGDFIVGGNPIDTNRMRRALERLKDMAEGAR